MRRVSPALSGVFVAALCAGTALAADCPACKLDCPRSTTNCWACGMRLPGSPRPDELGPVDIVVIKVLPEKKADRAQVATPEAELEKVEQWIAENPAEHDEAIKRLKLLMEKVSGTALEEHVADRMAKISARVAETTRPGRSAEEREDEAHRMVLQVMKVVRSNPDKIKENIRRLEGVLKIAEDTKYERYILSQLTILRKKLE